MSSRRFVITSGALGVALVVIATGVVGPVAWSQSQSAPHRGVGPVAPAVVSIINPRGTEFRLVQPNGRATISQGSATRHAVAEAPWRGVATGISLITEVTNPWAWGAEGYKRSPAPARNATITGYVRLCGGPAPGRCFIETIGDCQPPVGCVTSDRVAVIDTHGRQVAGQKLHHARFRVRVRPGLYTVELLGDGKHVHRRVMQREHVSARAGRTAIAQFFFAIP